MHTVHHMFKQCLIVLRFKDAHSSNYNIFQEESCLHQRVLFPKYGSLSWTNITWCIQKNDVQLWRTYFMCLHVPCVLHLRKYIVHSKGGVAESWVLSCWSFWFFAFLLFWFLVFLFFGFWFCLAIAEKPSRNCQWLQSSERTIADAVVAKMRCAVSVVAECSEKPHSQGVPFCIYITLSHLAHLAHLSLLLAMCPSLAPSNVQLPNFPRPPSPPRPPSVVPPVAAAASRGDVEPPPGAASRFAILKKRWETHEKYEK